MRTEVAAAGEKYRCTNTEGFLLLEKDSRGRNRGPNKRLIDALDPNGVHIVGMQFPHNDVEWRCKWLVKIKDQTDPVEIWMDNSFEGFKKWTMCSSEWDREEPKFVKHKGWVLDSIE